MAPSAARAARSRGESGFRCELQALPIVTNLTQDRGSLNGELSGALEVRIRE